MSEDSPFINYTPICPELKLLEDNFKEIQEEYLNNKFKLEFKDFTLEQEEYISKNKKGYPVTVSSYFMAKLRSERMGWHLAGIYGSGYFNPVNCKHLPKLVSILTQIQNLSVCGINILDSRQSLDWHNDDDYATGRPTLRTLWGLDVPVEEGNSSIFQMKNNKSGDIETRKFVNNEYYAFWPKTIHRVENNLSQSRAVLAVDVYVDKKFVPD